MFWTALKIVLFVAVVVGLVIGLESLTDQQAGLRLAVANTEYTLGPLQMAIALVLLLGLMWLFLKLAGFTVALLRFINGDDNALSRYFERNRRHRGLNAVTEGFLALAAGEGERALTKGRKAEKLLDDPVLTNLLIAQAAQAKGNTALAEDYYKRLLNDDRARFVGIQGLLTQQVEAGHQAKARKLAETALTLRPDHAPTQDRLLLLQNQAGDWAGARRTLAETTRSGRLPKPVYRRRDAVLTLQQSEAEEKAGNITVAQDLAIESNRLSPDLVPAAVRAARAMAARGNARPAGKILKRAWKTQPHPELAQAYAGIAPDEAPAARLKRFESLLAVNPGPEAQMTRAELLIAAEDFPGARRAMGDLHVSHPTQRVMTIMAAIERGEGSADQVVRGWLARALIAPRGAHWVCEKCHHEHAQWHALCAGCGAFDTLSWSETPDSSGPSATGTEMLPLIVGALPPAEAEAAASGMQNVSPVEETNTEPAQEAPAPVDEATEAPGKPGEEAAGIDLEQTRRMGL